MFRYLPILLLSLHLIAKTYQGCGSNEKLAREELAKNIYVSVDSQFEKIDKVSEREATKQVKSISKQTTKLKLINVQIEHLEDGQVCASIDENDLRKSLDSIVIEIDNFDIRKLSKEPKEAKSELQKVIDDCESGIKIASVLGKEWEIGFLSKKLQKLKSQLEKIYTQFVRFNLLDKNLRIYIDGEKHWHKINEDIPLKVGEHIYTIKSNDICEIKGKFTLGSDEVKIIDDIDIDKYRYPRITFTSNKESKYIYLEVNGKRESIGREKRYKKCSGELVYQAKYKDGDFEDREEGKIYLRPGLEKNIHLEFVSIGDIKAIKNEIQPYLSGDRLEILYSYGYIPKDYKYIKDTHNIAIHKLTHKRFFRYGYGLLYGVDDINSPKFRIAELYYIFDVQFTSFGKNELPIRVGKFSLIPYGGVEVGIGYHQYKYNGERVYSYPKKGDDDAKKRPDDYDWKFTRDSLVIKPTFGVDIVLSKGFALKFYGEKNLYIDQRWFFGTGLSIQF